MHHCAVMHFTSLARTKLCIELVMRMTADSLQKKPVAYIFSIKCEAMALKSYMKASWFKCDFSPEEKCIMMQFSFLKKKIHNDEVLR